MQPEELYWSLLNRNDLRQVSGLTFDQMRFVISLLEPSTFGGWLAWHEGLDKWKPLKDFKALQTSPVKAPLQSPPIPPQPRTDDEVTGTSDAIKAESMRVDKRVNRRFLKEFIVEIRDPRGVTFTTKTVNLSTGGMMLAEAVPEDFGRNFQCKVSRADGSSLTSFCSVLKDSDSESRKRVKFMDVSQIKILMAWLIDSSVT